MDFKQHMAADIENIFINLNEFAETVTINGAKVNVMEDSDKLLYRIQKNYDGLIIGDVLFYISTEEYAKIPHLSPVPTANQAIRYNGKAATITNVGKQGGLYEIIIQNAGGY
jgi:hypothetical protein